MGWTNGVIPSRYICIRFTHFVHTYGTLSYHHKFTPFPHDVPNICIFIFNPPSTYITTLHLFHPITHFSSLSLSVSLNAAVDVGGSGGWCRIVRHFHIYATKGNHDPN